MLNKKVKEEIFKDVEMQTCSGIDLYDYKVILENGEEIDIMHFIPRSQSVNGDYEPLWSGNLEGIKMCIEQYEELQGREFTEDEIEELEEFVFTVADSLIKHTTAKLTDINNGLINEAYATYSNCTKKEFEKALECTYNNKYEYEIIEESFYIHKLIDTRKFLLKFKEEI